MTSDDQRAILSLTADDVIALEEICGQYANCEDYSSHPDRPLAVEWGERFANMRYHLTDRASIHYTDLGTTP